MRILYKKIKRNKKIKNLYFIRQWFSIRYREKQITESISAKRQILVLTHRVRVDLFMAENDHFTLIH